MKTEFTHNMETRDDFVKSVKDVARQIVHDWPCIRFGQAVFNHVNEMYGDVARKVQFNHGIDCFYDDNKVEPFLDKCYELIKNSIQND